MMGLFNDVFNAKNAEETYAVLNKWKSDKQKTEILGNFLKNWRKIEEIKSFCKNEGIANGESLKNLIKTLKEEICETKEENGILFFKIQQEKPKQDLPV